MSFLNNICKTFSNKWHDKVKNKSQNNFEYILIYLIPKHHKTKNEQDPPLATLLDQYLEGIHK